ncbi:MAG: non-homologous end-joining DNA ligase [Bdellovibrionota bacterium]
MKHVLYQIGPGTFFAFFIRLMSSLDVALHDLLKLKKNLVRKSALDGSFLKPQLASLSEDIPTGARWIFETKFDGYRILAIKTRRGIRLMSRNGKDWTHRFENVVRSLEALDAVSFVVDGEMVVADKTGTTSFSALQKMLSEESKTGFVYYSFDLTYLNGKDLRPLPLVARKLLLETLLKMSAGAVPALKYSAHHIGDGKKIFSLACRNHTEGILAKDSAAPYAGRRSKTWLKIKCVRQDELVIGGYTDPAGSRQHFGALLVGYFNDDGRFCYAGKVGTGFDQKLLASLHKKLQALEVEASPFENPLSPIEQRGAHFVKPRLVAQLSYTEWTPDGRLRHPVFLGMREDKAARTVQKPKKISLKKKNKERTHGTRSLVR